MAKKSEGATSSVCREKDEEVVLDAAFLKLMDNFSSTKLFPRPVIKSPEEKTNAENLCEEDIITPLKNFHLRRPFNSRRALKKQKKAGKATNDLNLAVAAGFIHKPVVWPARLKSTSKNSNSKILQPARFSVINLSNDCAEPVEKVLNKKVIKTLQRNTSLDLKKVLSVTKSDNRTQRVFGITEGSCVDETSLPTFLSLREESSDTSKNENNAPTYSDSACFLRFRSPSQHFNPCSPTAQGNLQFNNNNSPVRSKPVENQSLVASVSPSQSALSTSSPDGARMSRTCSHEMRLEETNVNELASYFEDLLHIPRKMSTMAEMMYA